jgi:methionyl-tRNA synthetase
VWSTVARANEFVDRQAPWKLAKDPARHAELAATLATLVRQLARQAVALSPYMPAKAEELWAQLGGPGRADAQRFAALDALDVTGWRVRRGASLFPKTDPPAATG